MFNKVIVGDDGLAGGADALALARALAPAAEMVRVTAVSAPAPALHERALTEGADLIVVGTARRGAVGRMLLGDVSRAVLHGAPCPVAIAPRGFAAFAAGRPSSIGVAFDFSPEAERALRLAVALGEGLGAARVKVREVIQPDMTPAIVGYPIANLDEIALEVADDAERRLDDHVAALGGQLPIETEAILGATGDRLDELARDVDLVVCGSRGWGTARRVVLGSTADRLIHRSAAPVLVVPRSAARRAQPGPSAPAELLEA